MFIIKTFVFGPFQENTYVLSNETKNCIIIDPGCYFDEEQQALIDYINQNELMPIYLLNTHCHLDHVFGNKKMAETFQLKLYMHPLEKKLFDYAPTSGLMYNVPFDNYVGDIAYLEAGDTVALGTDILTAIHTPGHSPGSLSFYCAAQGFVVSGDVLFENSIGRTDLPGGDLETLLRSIKHELFKLPDATVVYSGHGDVTTIGLEKKGNPYLQ
jgi:glyoxylase-like metal-dependent hydrolase (beta-lactamase superfamily II)